MTDADWTTSYSVNSRVSLPFAWAYMTTVSNWDDPPATFHLDGPFTAGSRGTTSMPGQEPWSWQIADVKPLESYVMEMPLDGAAISFEWRFDRVPEGTRLTQIVLLRGEKAGEYVALVEAGFGSNLAAGMNRIVAAMEHASDASA